MKKNPLVQRCLLALIFLAPASFTRAAAAEPPSLFDRQNIAALWIVPYDAKKRGPEERAQMLRELGLTKLAYDWRAEHVPTFNAEIEAMQKHGIEITAWWYPSHKPEILDAIKRFPKLDAGRVLIDHVEEHTAKLVLDRGFWCGMTLYPDTKCTPQRAVDIFEMHGTERLWINSAGDWGQSDPLAVPKTQIEMKARGHTLESVRKVSFDNPLEFLSQSGRFRIA